MLRTILSYTDAQVPFLMRWIDENGKYTPNLFVEATSPEWIAGEALWVQGKANLEWEKAVFRFRFHRDDDTWSNWQEIAFCEACSRTGFDSDWGNAKALWADYLAGGKQSDVVESFNQFKEEADNQFKEEAEQYKKQRRRYWAKGRKRSKLKTARRMKKIVRLGFIQVTGRGVPRALLNGWRAVMKHQSWSLSKGDIRIFVRDTDMKNVLPLLGETL
jgi:hypothetical protein